MNRSIIVTCLLALGLSGCSYVIDPSEVQVELVAAQADSLAGQCPNTSLSFAVQATNFAEVSVYPMITEVRIVLDHDTWQLPATIFVDPTELDLGDFDGWISSNSTETITATAEFNEATRYCDASDCRWHVEVDLDVEGNLYTVTNASTPQSGWWAHTDCY